MARQYLYHNGEQIPLNGQDFWVGTHEEFENANPPIPKGTLLYFTDGEGYGWAKLLDESITSTEVSKPINLNGIGELSISLIFGNFCRGTVAVPIDILKQKIVRFPAYIGSDLFEVLVTYVSDTEVKVKCGYTSATNLVIYGR